MALYGIYRGRVVNNMDPAMKGRVQVVVPAAGSEATAWASACRDSKSSGSPPVGADIWVMFENGDPSRPVCMGCAN